MKYTPEKVSQDAETREHVLVLREVDGDDYLALNVGGREAQALQTLLLPEGLPGRGVLDHLRDAAAGTVGRGQVVGVRLLLSGGPPQGPPSLMPVLVVREDGARLERAVPASLVHAAAWCLSLGLPIEVDAEVLSVLRATATLVPGKAPAGISAFLEGLDTIDAI